MIKKETVLNYASTEDDKLILSKEFDNYSKSYNRNYNTFSDFYGFEKQELVKNAFSTVDDINHIFYGGYDKAERVISAFLVNDNYDKFPVLCIKISGKFIEKLSHRDVLGALMSLGIKRETIGDIITGNDIYVFVKEEIAEYIVLNLVSIGKYGVSPIICEDYIIEKEEKTEEIVAFVSSVRLDSVIRAGFNIRRTDCVKLIKDGRVVVSGKTITNPDYKPKENDSISVKGHGKIIYNNEDGTSRKGKIIINITKLV